MLPQSTASELDARGLIVLRNALDRAALQPVASAAQAYMRAVCEGATFPDSYRFHPTALAADLVAIDPWTAGEPNTGQVERTLLYRVMMDGLRARLRNTLGPRLSFLLARVRVALPEGSGKQGTHQEKKVADYPGLLNVWLPLSDGANETAPGIQFYLDRRAEMVATTRSPPSEIGAIMNAGGAGVLRPLVNIGDAILFDRHVPHKTFIPQECDRPRVNFDIRLYPTPAGQEPSFPL